jgi:hypothetical protein
MSIDDLFARRGILIAGGFIILGCLVLSSGRGWTSLAIGVGDILLAASIVHKTRRLRKRPTSLSLENFDTHDHYRD